MTLDQNTRLISSLVDDYLQLKDQQNEPQALTRDEEILDRLVDHLQNKRITLLEVISYSGKSLTNESVDVRARANGLLSRICGRLVQSSTMVPTKHQVKHLIEFFCDKLADKPMVVLEALTGLRALVRTEFFEADEVTNCCRALFDISMSDFTQPGRLSVHMLLDSLLAQHPLKKMGAEFLTGYCSLVDGEKDPRNLMVTFKLSRVILIEFDLGDKVEDMFDIIFCYFPITFRPPPGNADAYGGITSKDLTEALIECLAATHRFAILALPLMLDKFQAPGREAKIQVLQAIIQAFPVYGQAAVAEFASLFWESFFIEIFQPNTPNKDLLRLLEMACQTLLRTVFPPETSGSPSGPLEFINHILDMILKELRSPEKSKAVPATQLLSWLIKSQASAKNVIQPTINQSMTLLLDLWKQYKDGGGNDQTRVSILSHLSTLFDAISAYQKAPAQPSSRDQLLAPLVRDEVFSILIAFVLEVQGHTSFSCRTAAMKSLVKLCGIDGALSAEELHNTVEMITKVFLSSTDKGTSKSSLDCLSTLADLQQTLVRSITLPEIFGRLANLKVDHTLSDATSPSYLQLLEALVTLCHRHDLFEPFVSELLERLESQPKPTCAIPTVDTVSTQHHLAPFDYPTYYQHILLSMFAVIKSKVESIDNQEGYISSRAQVAACASAILARLFKILLPFQEQENAVLDSSGLLAVAGQFNEAHAFTFSQLCSSENNKKLLPAAGRLVNLLVQQLSQKEQHNFMMRFHVSEDSGQASPAQQTGLNEFERPDQRSYRFVYQRMLNDPPDAHPTMAVLYSNALIALRPNIIIPDEILSTTQSLAFRSYKHALETGLSEMSITFKQTLRSLCSTVNRRASDFPDFFHQQLDEFWESEIKSNASADRIPRFRLGIEIWVWITKGLVIRSDECGYRLLNRMILLLREPDVGRWAAQRLSLLVDERDGTLTVRNFAIIKFLWKQRLCHHVITKLVDNYSDRNNEVSVQTAYLTGLCDFLAHVAPSLISSEINRVMPLLMDTLKRTEVDPKLNALKIIHGILLDSKYSNSLAGHLPDLVPVLLPNCLFVTPSGYQSLAPTDHMDLDVPICKNPQLVRISSLKILALLPSIPIGLFPSSTSSDGGVSKLKSGLYGEKANILKALMRALDDPKREVRRLAVDCRERWASLSLV